MTGFLRNLFGPYKLFDTPDYEDLVPKFLFVEKWAIYCSGCVATWDILLGKNPPKGFLMTANRALKFIGPVSAASATFVGVLYASSHLRGKKDDEYNALNATIVSGALFSKMVKSPWNFMSYCIFVGLFTNIFKQAELYNWRLHDEETQRKRREVGFATGPYLIDWTVVKERPPKWINGDELESAKAN